MLERFEAGPCLQAGARRGIEVDSVRAGLEVAGGRVQPGEESTRVRQATRRRGRRVGLDELSEGARRLREGRDLGVVHGNTS
ncbi:MAG: hypothetical protein SangKO_080630 [Sandaracinaceae bacterium]